jgi:hypothetical protein
VLHACALLTVSAALCEVQVHSAFFFRLDLRNETVKPRRAGGWVDANKHEVRMSDAGFEPLAQPACVANATTQPASILDEAIRTLKPVHVATATPSCYCARHAEQCSCAALRTRPSSIVAGAGGSPIFWEQMQRAWDCYGDVRRYEGSRGVRFDFITKVRSDYDWLRNGLTPSAFAAALQSSIADAPRVTAANWMAEYSNVDWYCATCSKHYPSSQSYTDSLALLCVDRLWIAPRELARAAFSLSEAPCAFLECLASRRRLQSDGGLLGEWWLAHGVPFEALKQTRGTTHNGVDVRKSQAEGLITPSHARFLPRCPPSRHRIHSMRASNTTEGVPHKA